MCCCSDPGSQDGGGNSLVGYRFGTVSKNLSIHTRLAKSTIVPLLLSHKGSVDTQKAAWLEGRYGKNCATWTHRRPSKHKLICSYAELAVCHYCLFLVNVLTFFMEYFFRFRLGGGEGFVCVPAFEFSWGRRKNRWMGCGGGGLLEGGR